MCVCRVFALSQYLCTASGQRTRHLVTFPEVSLLAEKYFFDKQNCTAEAVQFFCFYKTVATPVPEKCAHRYDVVILSRRRRIFTFKARFFTSFRMT